MTGHEVDVVRVGEAVEIVLVTDAETKGQRSVRRLRESATAREIAGLSTDEILALLRGE